MKAKKLVTIKHVAAMAGVSVSAVSAAFSKKQTSSRLSPETKQKILDIAASCGYTPNLTAKAFQAGRSYLIALLFNSQGWHFMDKVVKNIRSICYENEYEILFYPCDNVEMERRNLLAAHRRNPDGILTLPLPDTGDGNRDLYEQYASEGITVVQFLHRISDKLPYVGRDFQAVVNSAIEIFQSKGYQEIVLAAFENYGDKLCGGSNYLLTQAYLRRMKELDLPAKILATDFKGTARDYVSHGLPLAKQMLETSTHPLGIITVSNSLAYGMMTYFRQHWIRLPEEIGLIGCSDDIDIPEDILPELSHYPIPASEIGEAVIKLCLGLKTLKQGNEILLASRFYAGKTV